MEALKRVLTATALATSLCSLAMQSTSALADNVKHVLLISIDGMHALDFINCANGIVGANGGAPYCPNLASLKATGVDYLDASTSKPSDSFPGLMAIVSGGSPRTVGAFYDVAYDRFLAPPTITTGNGVAGGSCNANQPNGTTTEFDEGIDLDKTKLNGGAPSGDGGINSIDPKKLERDPAHGCAPVYPWNFVRTNTIFGVVHAAGGYTAWSDKHPSYSSVSGPGINGGNLDDYYSPEINSIPVGQEEKRVFFRRVLGESDSCFIGNPNKHVGRAADELEEGGLIGLNSGFEDLLAGGIDQDNFQHCCGLLREIRKGAATDKTHCGHVEC